MARQPFIVIPVEPASAGASFAAAGRPASHLREYLYPGMIWEAGTATTVNNLTLDLGTAQSVDFAALLGVKVSAGAPTGALFGGSTPGGTDLYSAAATPLPDVAPVPTPANGEFQWFREFGPVTARHWLFQIGNPFAYLGSARFALVGRKISFGRYAEHDWEVGVDDLSTVSFTRGGVPDIAEGVIQRTLSFNLKWVTEQEYFEQVAPLDQVVGRQKPVLICFDPDAGSRRQALTFFGLLTENGRTRRANARAFERRFEIRSFI